MILISRLGMSVHAAVFLLLGATTFGQITNGDLDANGEVSLSDAAGFFGCLVGPDTATLAPSCSAAMFDADDDVDLYDVSAFQQRFGFGVGPPRIDRFWPTPGMWIVDDIGLAQIQVGFTEPVVVPREAIIAWLVSRGIGDNRVEEFTYSYDTYSDVLTITFNPPLKDDRITLMLDYTIEDVAGRPLDGEIFNPPNAALPSGDGHNGGQAVFRIHVLQGDANRDGMVDDADTLLISDSLGLCEGEAGFDPDADVDLDGCVDSTDAVIVADALGRNLPEVDGSQPRVIGVYADGDFGSFQWLAVLFSERVEGWKGSERSCFLVDVDGNVIVPQYYGFGGFGDTLDFFFESEYVHCNQFRINLSSAIIDLSGELLVPLPPCICLEDCPPYSESP